jgi:hypothetical protein
MEASMLEPDDKFLLDNEADAGSAADQTVTETPADKRRARQKARKEAAKAAREAAPNRGRGRPKGAKNKLTIEREKVQELLHKSGPQSLSANLREPRDILIEAANFFMDRARFLSDHAKRMAEEEAGDTAIAAIMEENERLVDMASRCAERAAPYYHARVNEPLGDGAMVAYVARLPAPAASGDEWAADCAPERRKQGSH